MYGKEASNRKQEMDRQHRTIPNQRKQRPKDKNRGNVYNLLFRHGKVRSQNMEKLKVGVPFLGFFHTELSEILLQGICVLALSAAYTAIYCFFAMLIHNRTITAIACIMLSFLLLFSGTISFFFFILKLLYAET